MRLKDIEIKKIKANFDNLSKIEWIAQNDEKLHELFFGISDIFEKRLKRDDLLWDWRIIEIRFQHRALTDNEKEHPKTKKECISSINDFINQIYINGKF